MIPTIVWLYRVAGLAMAATAILKAVLGDDGALPCLCIAAAFLAIGDLYRHFPGGPGS